METYTYQEEVEYEYKILNVLLKNKGFDAEKFISASLICKAFYGKMKAQ